MTLHRALLGGVALAAIGLASNATAQTQGDASPVASATTADRGWAKSSSPPAAVRRKSAEGAQRGDRLLQRLHRAEGHQQPDHPRRLHPLDDDHHRRPAPGVRHISPCGDKDRRSVRCRGSCPTSRRWPTRSASMGASAPISTSPTSRCSPVRRGPCSARTPPAATYCARRLIRPPGWRAMPAPSRATTRLAASRARSSCRSSTERCC